MLDILIKGAWVVDGTGSRAYRGAIGVKDGRIVLIRRGGVDEGEARRVIDADGLVCSPGFIDLHSHSDYSIFIHNHAVSSLRAGVTTEAVGMCGYGVFPARGQLADEAPKRMAGMSQVPVGELGERDWETLDDWMQKLERRGIGINVAHFVGHGALRIAVMGQEGAGGEATVPSPEQLQAMKDELRACMEQGAFGLSSGLEYAPGRNATTGELVELCRVVALYGGAYVSHMRSEADLLISATKEFISICRDAGIPGSISHHKAIGEENWGKVRATLALMEEARSQGVDVICDFYPWEYAAQSNLGSFFYTDFEISPRDADSLRARLTNAGEWAALKSRLREQEEKERRAAEGRARVLAEHGVKVSGPEDPLASCYVVHSPSHPELVGANLREACRVLGDPEDAWEGLRRLYLDDEGYCQVAGGRMWVEDIRALVRHPLAAVSTDGWTLARIPDLRRPGISPHPRNYGTYARVLGEFVREERYVPLEEAVRKMTSLPAGLLGLRDRGLLAEGFWADLCLFDPANIANTATHSGPCAYPVGIKYVLVNGVVAVDNGEEAGALAGQVLRHKG
ncbi:MAG: D-aminoacylase [Bacillota bacterium]